MSTPLEAGLMSLGDLLPHPATNQRLTEADRHRQIVRQAVVAESLGFTSVHLGEHHFSDYMLSAPPVVLAAIGEHTLFGSIELFATEVMPQLDQPGT